MEYFLLLLISLGVVVVSGVYEVELRPRGLVRALAGQSISLDCAISDDLRESLHIEQIEWWKDGVKLTEQDKLRKQLSNGTLHLTKLRHTSYPPSSNPLEYDSGAYTCAVDFKNSGRIRSETTYLLIVPQDVQPKFLHQPRSLVARPGESAVFRCIVDTSLSEIKLLEHSNLLDQNAGSSTTVSITWYRYEEQLVTTGTRLTSFNSRDVASFTSVLHIQDVKPEDFAHYKCRAEVNWLGQEGPHASLGVAYSEFARLSRDDERSHYEAEAPRIILEPLSIYSPDGVTITLHCSAIGRDRNGALPRVTWLRNGATVDTGSTNENSKFKIIGGTHLEIKSLNEQDSGVYSCRASNSEDSTDSSAFINVLERPRIIESPSDQTVSAGSDIELRCVTHGQPKPRIRWFKNSKEIISQIYSPDITGVQKRNTVENHSEDGDSFINSDYIYSQDGGSRLKILGITENDAGFYQCFVESRGGVSQASAKITVLNNELKHVQSTADESSEYSLDVTIVDVMPRSVALSWKFSVESGEKDLVEYLVECMEEKTGRIRVINTSVTEVLIEYLKPSTMYQIRVYVHVNGRVFSAMNKGTTVETLNEVAVPSAPVELSALPTEPGSIQLSWVYMGQESNITYRVYFYKHGNVGSEREIEVRGEGSALRQATPNTLIYTITDLSAYQNYVFRVQAFNNNGGGRSSDEISCITLSDVPTQPPQNITVEAVSSKNILIRWEEPVLGSTNGILTGYKIRYRRSGDRGGAIVTTDIVRRMYELEGLDRAMEYSVRIAAHNVNGTGPYSNWVNIETFYNDLDESVVPGQPKALKARPMTNSIGVSWMAPDNHNKITIRGYILGYGIGIPDVYRQILDAKYRQYTIKGLKSNSDYVISVRAFNSAGEGEPKYETVFTRQDFDEPQTPLVPPVGLRAVVRSSTSVQLHWTDSSLDLDDRVTDNRFYTVKYSPKLGQRPRYLNVTSLSLHLDDLRPDTEYEFSVRLVKGQRVSAWSLSAFNRTSESLPASAPRDLILDPIQGRSGWTSLSWQPPRQSNGLVTGYLISYTRDASVPDSDWLVEGVQGDRVSTVIRDLAPQTTYFFKIMARNAMGYGPFSPTAIYRTPDGKGGGMLNDFDRSHRYGGILRTQNDQGLIPVDSSVGQHQTNSGVPEYILWIIIACVTTLCIVAIVTGIICYRLHGVKSTSENNRTNQEGVDKTTEGSIGGQMGGLKPPDLWIHDQVRGGASTVSNRSSSIPGSSVVGGNIPDDASTLSRNMPDTDLLEDLRLSGRRPTIGRPVMIPIDHPPLPREPLSSLLPMSSLMTTSTSAQISGGLISVGSPDRSYSTGAPALPYRPLYPRTGLTQAPQGLNQGALLYTTAPRVNAAGLLDCDMQQSAAAAADQAFSTLERHRLKNENARRAQTTQRATVRPTQLQQDSGPTVTRLITQSPDVTSEQSTHLLKSVSTDDLTAEMCNLEGLMKDLGSITRHEFNC